LNKPLTEVLLMKINNSKKSIWYKSGTSSIWIYIGKFHLNSKLRFLTFSTEEPIKLSQRDELLKMLILHENDLMQEN
jgi:hypothetical protein